MARLRIHLANEGGAWPAKIMGSHTGDAYRHLFSIAPTAFEDFFDLPTQLALAEAMHAGRELVLNAKIAGGLAE